MKIFTRLYDATLKLSEHRLAKYWLALVSFSESVFFPVPPDVMLAPMTLVRPQQVWQLALITTLSSVLGGLVGYTIGYAFIDYFLPVMAFYGYQATFELANQWFNDFGIWIIFAAGFTPIPYKIFTISAGAFGFALVPFMLISTVGRGLRFFLVAGLVAWKGQALMQRMYAYIDTISYTLLVCLILYFLYRYLV